MQLSMWQQLEVLSLGMLAMHLCHVLCVVLCLQQLKVCYVGFVPLTYTLDRRKFREILKSCAN